MLRICIFYFLLTLVLGANKDIKHTAFYYKSLQPSEALRTTQDGQKFDFDQWTKSLKEVVVYTGAEFYINFEYVEQTRKHKSPTTFTSDYYSSKLNQFEDEYLNVISTAHYKYRKRNLIEDGVEEPNVEGLAAKGQFTVCSMAYQAIQLYEDMLRAIANEMHLLSQWQANLLDFLNQNWESGNENKIESLNILLRSFEDIMSNRLSLYNLAVHSSKDELEIEYWVRQTLFMEKDFNKLVEEYWKENQTKRQQMSPQYREWWQGPTEIFISQPELDPYRPISLDEGKKLVYHQIKEKSHEWPNSKYLQKSSFDMSTWKGMLYQVVRFNIQTGYLEVRFALPNEPLQQSDIGQYFEEQISEFVLSLPHSQQQPGPVFHFYIPYAFTIAERLFDHYLVAIAHQINSLIRENKPPAEKFGANSEEEQRHEEEVDTFYKHEPDSRIEKRVGKRLAWLLKEYIVLKKQQRVIIGLASELDKRNETYWYNRQEKLKRDDVHSHKTWRKWINARAKSAAQSPWEFEFWWIKDEDDIAQQGLFNQIWNELNHWSSNLKTKKPEWLIKSKQKVLNAMCITNERIRSEYLLVNKHEGDGHQHTNHYTRIKKRDFRHLQTNEEMLALLEKKLFGKIVSKQSQLANINGKYVGIDEVDEKSQTDALLQEINKYKEEAYWQKHFVSQKGQTEKLNKQIHMASLSNSADTDFDDGSSLDDPILTDLPSAKDTIEAIRQVHTHATQLIKPEKTYMRNNTYKAAVLVWQNNVKPWSELMRNEIFGQSFGIFKNTFGKFFALLSKSITMVFKYTEKERRNDEVEQRIKDIVGIKRRKRVWNLKTIQGIKNGIYMLFRFKYFRAIWTKVVTSCLVGILVVLKLLMMEIPLWHSPTTYIMLLDLFLAIIRPNSRTNMTIKFCNYISSNENFSQPYLDIYLDVKGHLSRNKID